MNTPDINKHFLSESKIMIGFAVLSILVGLIALLIIPPYIQHSKTESYLEKKDYPSEKYFYSIH